MRKNAMLVMLIIALMISPLVASAQTMYVVTTHPDESIMMYTEPDYNAGEVITSIPSGAAVDVNIVMADVPWAQVSYDGFTGYVALENLSEQNPVTVSSNGQYVVPSVVPVQTMYVTSHNGGGVHLRTSPTLNEDNIITTVPYGAEVGIIMIMADGPWAELEYDGQVGYMMLDYLTDSVPAVHPHTAQQSTNSGNTQLEAELATLFSGFLDSAYDVVVVPASGETYVNMRWAPSLSAPIRREYNADAQLHVTGHNDTWAEVYDPEHDIHGFMETVFLANQ